MKTLREALRSEELTLTAELTLSPQQSPVSMIEQARVLAAVTDAIQIPDHRSARPHISNIAAAALLLQNDIDPIIQMNCRDRSTGVFDVRTIDLIATAAAIRDGDAFADTRLPGTPDLYLGTVATAFNPADG